MLKNYVDLDQARLRAVGHGVNSPMEDDHVTGAHGRNDEVSFQVESNASLSSS